MNTAGKIVENVNLSIGQSITCLFSKTQRIKAVLVGVADQKFIILQLPYLSGIRSHVMPSVIFAAHVRLSHCVIFFSSAIEQVFEKKKLIICDYPPSFKFFEARATQRCPCFLPISLSSNEASMLGATRDIALNGCQLAIEATHYKTARNLQLNDMVQLDFGVSEASHFSLKGQIVYLKQGLTSTNVGVHFTHIPTENTARLRCLLAEHQREHC